ncbi:unnamed protein product [Brassica napus]|uniref:(rape) hypothetical protein n=1 Tax=Brassica napus TaxID=3708 RepID=A0A816R291_BRANA|nr:unnamed protein product [Brassica napus]
MALHGDEIGELVKAGFGFVPGLVSVNIGSPRRAFASPLKAPPYGQSALGERLRDHTLAWDVHGDGAIA